MKAMRGRFGFRVVWKNHGSRFSPAGLPDVMGVARGRLVAIELKTENDRPSDLQRKWVRDLIAAGGIAFFAGSVQEVVDYLRLHGFREIGDAKNEDAKSDG